MDIRVVFGLNVRRLRLGMPGRISQEAAADRMHIDRAHFSRVERGIANITILNIGHVAAVLECEWADLFNKQAAAEFASRLKTASPRVARPKSPARKR